MLAQSQMSVAYGAHPRLLSQGLNLNHLDKDERERALATLREGVDEALEIGATSFVFLSGKWEEATKEDSYKALVDSTLSLCEYAKSQGDLEVVHENFDQDIDKASLIGPTPLAVRYAEEIRRAFPDFGLLVDLSHIPLIGETPEESLIPVKDYLATVDLGNCVKADPSLPRYGDTHPCFGYPGGENDVAELVDFLDVLLDIGFLSFEVRPGEGEDSEVYIANAKRTLNEAWARVCY
jgi:sugar phosphate isomerase/epimerase